MPFDFHGQGRLLKKKGLSLNRMSRKSIPGKFPPYCSIFSPTTETIRVVMKTNRQKLACCTSSPDAGTPGTHRIQSLIPNLYEAIKNAGRICRFCDPAYDLDSRSIFNVVFSQQYFQSAEIASEAKNVRSPLF